MTALNSNAIRRLPMGLIATIGWFALLLQLFVMVNNALSAGTSVTRALVNYLSFFTILTNVVVAFGLMVSILKPDSRWGRVFSHPLTTAGTAVCIAMVGLGYSALLRHLWAPEGLQKIADVLLHDVVPLFYGLYWLMVVPKTALRWRSVLLWLIYPMAYLSYSLLRGAISGWYPYPFINASALGYVRVLLNAAVLLLVFLGVSLVVVAISRWKGSSSPAAVPRFS